MPPAGPASSPARAIWDVSEQGQALLAVLFPHLAGLRVHRIEDVTDAVIIVASCRGGGGVLPAVRSAVGASARRVSAHGG
jgi:hypothetical protein